MYSQWERKCNKADLDFLNVPFVQYVLEPLNEEIENESDPFCLCGRHHYEELHAEDHNKDDVDTVHHGKKRRVDENHSEISRHQERRGNHPPYSLFWMWMSATGEVKDSEFS